VVFAGDFKVKETPDSKSSAWWFRSAGVSATAFDKIKAEKRKISRQIKLEIEKQNSGSALKLKSWQSPAPKPANRS
jgi:hypothetical protein